MLRILYARVEMYKMTFPAEWQTYKIGEIGEVVTGTTPPMKDPDNYGGNLVWAKPPDLDKSKFVCDSKEKISEIGRQKVRVLPPGAVLVSCIGTIGKVAIAGCELCTNQQINSIVPNDKIADSNFLFFLIRRIQPLLEKASSSAVVPLLNKKNFSDIEIALPPIHVQQKIASLLRQAEQLQQWRKESDKLTNYYLNSIFLKMFGDPAANPKGWNKTSFGKLIVEMRYGTSLKCGSDKKGIPVLRIPNIIRGTIDFTDLKYAESKISELKKYKVTEGDLLFVRTNGNRDNVGRSAVFYGGSQMFAFASYLIKAKPSKDLDPIFANTYLALPYARKQLFKSSRTSAGQYNINTHGLKSVKFILPPITLQQKFSSLAKNIQSIVEKQYFSQKEINNLSDLLIKKAFGSEI